MSFTHLEVHSHFTMLGGTAAPAQLAAQAAGAGFSCLALTDTHALYGAVAFARACAEAGIQPIIGMTVLTTGEPAGRTPVPQGDGSQAGRLVLLARDHEGYRSLCRLASLLQGAGPLCPEAPPALDWDLLRAHRSGLICLSGGRLGWVERYLRGGDVSSAQVYAGRLAGIFGEDACLALELHQESAEQDALVAREVLGIGRRLGLPVAAVQPVYCLAPGDAERLRLLAAIRGNCRLDDLPAAMLPGAGVAEIHWLAPDEVVSRFAAFPEAVGAAGGVAARCGPALPDGHTIWPAVSLPPGQSPDQALANLAWAGALSRYGLAASATGDLAVSPASDASHPDASAAVPGLAPRQQPAHGPAEAQVESQPGEADPAVARLWVRARAPTLAERLEHELAAIGTHGYAPLFLVVAGIVGFAHENGIPVSTRGSVANSLVAYTAGITDVDPMAHNLLFERFLSPARLDAPDIDLDLCSRRRDEVLAYVRRTYGVDRMALVGAVSTLRLPSAVRATAKALGWSEEETGRLAARLPHQHGRNRDAAVPASPGAEDQEDGEAPDAGDGEAQLEQAADGGVGAGLPAWLNEIEEPRWQDVVRRALEIVGQPDHMTVHACGVVIANGAMTDVLPVQWAPKGFLITQFEHGDLAAVGLPKIDLLGVRALTVLADAADLVRRRDPAFRLDEVPRNDPLTGDLLARAETIGVFQCESDGARSTLRRLRARTETDLAIANAFFKPGPSTGGMAQAFVRRYRGEERAAYLHPALEPILAPTKGVLIFQEQVLRIAHELAGLNWAEADRLRRGKSRMQPREMLEMQARFEAGCRRPSPAGPGMSAEQAAALWTQVAAFAGYGFNQGHALAYGAVSYRSAYLKAHWPAEFLCARLADAGGFHHPVIYMVEAIRLGFAVRPPHVNTSCADFTLDNCDPPGPVGRQANPAAGQRGSPHIGEPGGLRPTIWMGLSQVRDLRQSAIRAIVHERASRPFSSLRDLLARVELHPKEVRHLIQCGALDGLGVAGDVGFGSRAMLLAEAGQAVHDSRASVRGGAVQLAFAFAGPEVRPEPAAQRCAWETIVLGVPLTALADPLALLVDGAAGADQGATLPSGAPGAVRPVTPPHGAAADQQSTHPHSVSAAPAVTSPNGAAGAVPPHQPLAALFPAERRPGSPVVHSAHVIGLRLPGWTGGPGFYLWDGQTLVTARYPARPRAGAPGLPPPWLPLLVRGHRAGDGWGTWWFEIDDLQVIRQSCSL